MLDSGHDTRLARRKQYSGLTLGDVLFLNFPSEIQRSLGHKNFLPPPEIIPQQQSGADRHQQQQIEQYQQPQFDFADDFLARGMPIQKDPYDFSFIYDQPNPDGDPAAIPQAVWEMTWLTASRLKKKLKNLIKIHDNFSIKFHILY